MENRRNAIVELINSKGSVSFAQLKEAFPQVSEMTLRTDLKALDQVHRIVRVHGGAKSVNVVIGTDGLLGQRIACHAEAKEEIAQKAVQLLRSNTTLYLDSGSTTTALARKIPDESYLIMTNSVSCVTELAKLKHSRVTMPGGVLNRYSMSLCGTQSVQIIQKVNFDWMFLGVTGYCDGLGFTCGVEEESLLKQMVMRRSDQVVVLMDSSKIGLKSTYTICDLEDVDMVISEGNLPEEFLNACQHCGVTVY